MKKEEFYVYAIRSLKDNRIYVGMSQDIERRLCEHNNGQVKSTKGYCPWIRFFEEYAGSTESARDKEKYYKSSSGKRKLRRILERKSKTI